MTARHRSDRAWWGRRGILSLGAVVPLLAACGRRETVTEGTTPPPSSGDALAPSTSEKGPTMRETTEPASTQGGHTKLDDSVLTDALALSPDGDLVAGSAGIGRFRAGKASTAGTVLWSTADGSVVRRFDDGLNGSLAWSPDGSLLAVGGPRHLELATPEGQVLWTLAGFGEPEDGQWSQSVLSIAFSPDSGTVVAAGADGSVRTWGLATDRCEPGPVIDARGLMVQSIAVAPDGRTLAIAGPDGPVELWSFR